MSFQPMYKLPTGLAEGPQGYEPVGGYPLQRPPMPGETVMLPPTHRADGSVQPSALLQMVNPYQGYHTNGMGTVGSQMGFTHPSMWGAPVMASTAAQPMLDRYAMLSPQARAAAALRASRPRSRKMSSSASSSSLSSSSSSGSDTGSEESKRSRARNARQRTRQRSSRSKDRHHRSTRGSTHKKDRARSEDAMKGRDQKAKQDCASPERRSRSRKAKGKDQRRSSRKRMDDTSSNSSEEDRKVNGRRKPHRGTLQRRRSRHDSSRQASPPPLRYSEVLREILDDEAVIATAAQGPASPVPHGGLCSHPHRDSPLTPTWPAAAHTMSQAPVMLTAKTGGDVVGREPPLAEKGRPAARLRSQHRRGSMDTTDSGGKSSARRSAHKHLESDQQLSRGPPAIGSQTAPTSQAETKPEVPGPDRSPKEPVRERSRARTEGKALQVVISVVSPASARTSQPRSSAFGQTRIPEILAGAVQDSSSKLQGQAPEADTQPLSPLSATKGFKESRRTYGNPSQRLGSSASSHIDGNRDHPSPIVRPACPAPGFRQEAVEPILTAEQSDVRTPYTLSPLRPSPPSSPTKLQPMTGYFDCGRTYSQTGPDHLLYACDQSTSAGVPTTSQMGGEYGNLGRDPTLDDEFRFKPRPVKYMFLRKRESADQDSTPADTEEQASDICYPYERKEDSVVEVQFSDQSYFVSEEMLFCDAPNILSLAWETEKHRVKPGGILRIPIRDRNSDIFALMHWHMNREGILPLTVSNVAYINRCDIRDVDGEFLGPYEVLYQEVLFYRFPRLQEDLFAAFHELSTVSRASTSPVVSSPVQISECAPGDPGYTLPDRNGQRTAESPRRQPSPPRPPESFTTERIAVHATPPTAPSDGMHAVWPPGDHAGGNHRDKGKGRMPPQHGDHASEARLSPADTEALPYYSRALKSVTVWLDGQRDFIAVPPPNGEASPFDEGVWLLGTLSCKIGHTEDRRPATNLGELRIFYHDPSLYMERRCRCIDPYSEYHSESELAGDLRRILELCSEEQDSASRSQSASDNSSQQLSLSTVTEGLWSTLMRDDTSGATDRPGVKIYFASSWCLTLKKPERIPSMLYIVGWWKRGKMHFSSHSSAERKRLRAQGKYDQVCWKWSLPVPLDHERWYDVESEIRVAFRSSNPAKDVYRLPLSE